MISNVGGAENSITYSGTPHFATSLWCYDFSVDGEAHWIFIHEFGHVWQSIYGTPPMLGFIANVVNNPDGYGKAYPYDLTTSTNYNLEVFPDANNPQLKANGLPMQFYYMPQHLSLAEMTWRCRTTP